MNKNLFAELINLLMLSTLLISCNNTNDEQYEKLRDGWVLEWEENFDSLLDTTVWEKESGGKYGLNRYMDSNEELYILNDGKLILRGMKNPLGENTTPFLTGGISRNILRKNEVARIEIKASMYAVSGGRFFIRLLPEDNKSEIAINVLQQYDSDDFIYQSVTTEYTTEKKMADNPPSVIMVGVEPNRYHIYGIERYHDSLVFFVDGVRTRKYPRILTQIAGQFPFKDLDLNLHVGVGINKDLDSIALPVDLFIDWVRYYTPAPSPDIQGRQ